jgi:hypothetical protein
LSDDGGQKAHIVQLVFQRVATATRMGRVETGLNSLWNHQYKMKRFGHINPMHHGVGSTSQTMNGKD